MILMDHPRPLFQTNSTILQQINVIKYCTSILCWDSNSQPADISFLPQPSYVPFSFIFSLFKQTAQILPQINVKNIHPVSGAGIRTHNLQNTSLLPLPLDQASRQGIGS